MRVHHSIVVFCIMGLIIFVFLSQEKNPHKYAEDELIAVIKGGDINRLDLCLSHNPNLNIHLGDDGKTPLILAISEKKYILAKYLIKKGADVNLTSTSSFLSPLDVAIMNGDLAFVKYLIAIGIKNFPTSKSPHLPDSVLSIAAVYGHVDLVKYFMRLGHDVHHPDHRNGFTALHYAIKYAKIKSIEYLLQRGSQINKIVKHNISNGELNSMLIAIPQGDLNVIKLLIAKGVDLKFRGGFFNETALEMAKRLKMEKIVRLLKNFLHIQNRQLYNK